MHKFNKFLNYENGSVNLTFFRRMLFAIFFIEIFKRPKIRCGAGVIPKRKQTEYTWLYINAFVLAIIMFSVTSNVFSAISGRVSAMFYSFYIFIYSDIFSDKRLKGFHIIYFLIFTALLFYSFNREIYNPNANFLPYTIRFL